MKLGKRIKVWAVPVSCCVTVLLMMRFVFFIGYVPTASMEPTIIKNSYVFGFRIYEELRLGDIVVFQHDGSTLVKRIAALPGQTIYIDDDTHSVSIDEELSDATRILTVPAGCYYMLGDNREESEDSRYWNEPFILEGQVIAVLR